MDAQKLCVFRHVAGSNVFRRSKKLTLLRMVSLLCWWGDLNVEPCKTQGWLIWSWPSHSVEGRHLGLLAMDSLDGGVVPIALAATSRVEGSRACQLLRSDHFVVLFASCCGDVTLFESATTLFWVMWSTLEETGFW